MNTDIYKTPDADLLSDSSSNKPICFYIVSKQKFVVLYLATLGLYSFYWVYKNWRNYKDTSGESIWPIPRAIFQLFFIHSLFRRVDDLLVEKNINYHWNAESTATIYVILLLVNNAVDRMSAKSIGSPLTDVLSIAIVPVMLWVLLGAQLAINTCLGDEKGSSNSSLTLYNWIWVMIGICLWAMAVLGLLMELGAVVI